MKDRFRKNYHTLKQENSLLIKQMKEKAEELEFYFVNNALGREMSLALTNLEQAMMWATKAIVLYDEKSQSEGA